MPFCQQLVQVRYWAAGRTMSATPANEVVSAAMASLNAVGTANRGLDELTIASSGAELSVCELHRPSWIEQHQWRRGDVPRRGRCRLDTEVQEAARHAGQRCSRRRPYRRNT